MKSYQEKSAVRSRQSWDTDVSYHDGQTKDVCDSDGVLERMQKGVIVRHLILPGQVEESKKVILLSV